MASIERRGKSFRIIVSNGCDATGKQRKCTKTWTPPSDLSEKQIEKALQKVVLMFEMEVKSGQCNGNMKLAQYIDYWFSKTEPQIRLSTRERYEEYAKRVVEKLGNITLNKLTPKHLMDFYEYLAQDGVNKQTHGPLSSKTIKEHHAFLSSILTKAVRWRFISENPTNFVEAPKVENQERPFLTAEQAVAVLERVQREQMKYRVCIMLLLMTGLRRGEVLGLEWQDIDFQNHTISVVRTSLYSKKEGFYTGKPKTRKSERTISIPSEMIDLLKVYKVEQYSHRLLCGGDWDPEWDEHPRLFVQADGKPMHPNAPYKRMRIITEELGLPSVGLHGLRHTHATLLIANKTDPRTVSGRLGHSHTSTTMNIYAHFLKNADEDASETVADILFRGKNSG